MLDDEIERRKEISTHTPLARRDVIDEIDETAELISTHTPLARRDTARRLAKISTIYFYSHASCEA